MEGKTGGDHQARELAFRPTQRVQQRKRYVKRVRGCEAARMCAPVEKGASCVSESRYRREARREKGRFEKVESRGRGENAREGGSGGGWREAGWRRVKATTGGTRGDERGTTLTEEHDQALTGDVLQASGPV